MLNPFAEAYVKLALATGRYDPDYIDAYYGPPEWKLEAEAALLPLDAIQAEARTLIDSLQALDPSGQEEIVQLRHHYLLKQLAAMVSRIGMLQGMTFSFDEESRLLYDAVAPHYGEEHYQKILDMLDGTLPGEGSLAARYERFKQGFIIPIERLDLVFTTAIREARKRTMAHIELPPGEHFDIEYVTGKSWSGYNWYQGNARSLIQVNTDLPVYIDRAIDLASHEGYPGHHVYSTLLEQHLVLERGWVEFSIYPLFSPQSLIAEGSANFGIDVAFSRNERVDFEREVLFPLAGLDPSMAEDYNVVEDMVAELSYAGNEAALQYLNGEIEEAEAVNWLVTYALMPVEHARRRVRFFDQYRSYVINYNLGKDLVRRYIERRGGTPSNPTRRWELFTTLLSSPRLPSGLTE